MYNGARQLNIPTPHPPIARPKNNTHNARDKACSNPPHKNITQASNIVRLRLYLSARWEQVKLPKKAPSSREEVSMPFMSGVRGKRSLKGGMMRIAETMPWSGYQDGVGEGDTVAENEAAKGGE
jgi:hypothetical protein